MNFMKLNPKFNPDDPMQEVGSMIEQSRKKFSIKIKSEDYDWYCDWCNKGMMNNQEGYCHDDGICYCTKECAQEKDWNR